MAAMAAVGVEEVHVSPGDDWVGFVRTLGTEVVPRLAEMR
jgi:hypothetical protein